MSKSLGKIESLLNAWLQPKLLAEKWDNVGLLVGSGRFAKNSKPVERILLCNDLTTKVFEEAVEKKADLIIPYHPLIFQPLKSVGYDGSWKESVVARCLGHDISVYSPHTTFDSIHYGVNDSLIDGICKDFGAISSYEVLVPKNTSPFTTTRYTGNGSEVASLFTTVTSLEDVIQSPNIVLGFDTIDNRKEKKFSLVIKTSDKAEEFLEHVKSAAEHLKLVSSTNVDENIKPELKFIGPGRKVQLMSEANLEAIIENVKKNLNLGKLQLVYGGKKEIKTIAVCAGSGGSLLKDVKADLFVTGEMSHHELLDCLESNTSVILCGHCNSERHFLPKFAEILKLILDMSEIMISTADKSPFDTV